jgi:hypothetical protein
VDHITINNDTDYSALIEVAGSSHDGWLNLGGVSQHQVTAIDQVIDEGHEWVFRLRTPGGVTAEFEISRSELTRNKWTVTIPQTIETHFRRAGEPPG